ncbi:hypothetical protein HDV02_002864 [Globomyces sp. JEL0801]|nr:hypothetical protein HDV02_002864 [Globomyces sp. JEL0801]
MPQDLLQRRALIKLTHSLKLNQELSSNNEPKSFECCKQKFMDEGLLKKHLIQNHWDWIQSKKLEIDNHDKSKLNHQQFLKEYTKRRCDKGGSDPIELNCDCNNNGTVLLFYNYVALQDSKSITTLLSNHCHQLNLTGKVRISNEGYNITVAGSTNEINSFIDLFLNQSDILLPGFDLLENQKELIDQFIFQFFKPTLGCVHVFQNMSVKYVEEICPLNVSKSYWDPQIPCTSLNVARKLHSKNLNPTSITHTETDVIQTLLPSEYHQLLKSSSHDSNTIILDVRNYYESKLGHFKNSITPPIRKFSTLPEYIKNNSQQFKDKTIFTYCTGGIRCEKAARYIQNETGSNIIMLEGGIHNYINWINESNEESLFQGLNYIFDARQSIKHSNDTIITNCLYCKQKCGIYKKCSSKNCHLLVECCQPCFDLHDKQIFCCHDCQHQTGTICECERNRLDDLSISRNNLEK